MIGMSPGQCGQSILIEGMEIRVEKNSGANCVRPIGIEKARGSSPSKGNGGSNLNRIVSDSVSREYNRFSNEEQDHRK